MVDARDEDRPRAAGRGAGWLLFAGVGAFALAIGVLTWVAGQGAPAEIQGTVLERPRPVPDFQLLDQDGVAVDGSMLRGRWSVLFFGFTHCPDVCPTTLYSLKRAVAELDQPPQVIFVSVDPMRDTVERIAPYVRYFDPAFIGLTGELADVQALTDGLGVAVAYVPLATGEGGGAEGYTVDHTASLFVIDPQGRLAALLHAPHHPAALARDLEALSR